MTNVSSKTMLALLAATAALAGGAQALVPSPATAVVNQGEECDPNLPSSDCEPNGGGGGDSSGGSGQDGGGGPIVGEETIEVSGELPPLRPSPCTQSSCLARQLGGGPRPGRDGGRNANEPRHGGRPTRAAEAVDAQACGKLTSTLNAINDRLLRVEVVFRGLLAPLNERVSERVAEVEKQMRLMNLVFSLRNRPDPDPDTILGVEEQVLRQMARTNAMLVAIERLEDLIEPLHRQRADLLGKAHAVKQELKRCAAAADDDEGPGLEPQRGDRHV